MRVLPRDLKILFRRNPYYIPQNSGKSYGRDLLKAAEKTNSRDKCQHFRI